MTKKASKKAAKSAPKKTVKAKAPTKRAPDLSDAGLNRLLLALMKVVDYDTAKEVFGPEPESPADAEAIKAQARGVIRKHFGG